MKQKAHGDTKSYNKPKKGGAIVMVLVFAGVFVIAVGALMQFVLQQSINGRGKAMREQSLQVAEAGMEYYKWHLAHNPNQSSEVRTVEYQDPANGQRVGEFTITATSTQQCGMVQYHDVSVTGHVDAYEGLSRTVAARHMLPSVANYAQVLNSDVWQLDTESLIGPFHSNGGIHMDGAHNSLVSSGVATWLCNASLGCNPSATKPGVWGSGGTPSLWRYPSQGISFAAMVPDYASLKAKAIASGRYFAPIADAAGTRRGYHITFKSNGTFDVRTVLSNELLKGRIPTDFSYVDDYHKISSESFLGNYTVPSDCSLIFVEDQAWVDGIVSGKVAVVVASPGPAQPDAVLSGNITYATGEQNDGLNLIAEHDVLVSAYAPESMTISGIFAAPQGLFGRHHYVEASGTYWPVNQSVHLNGIGTKQELDDLTINGSIVSKEQIYLSWEDDQIWYNAGGWHVISEDSGFTVVANAYSRMAAFAPPPFTPRVSTVPQYMQWHEVH